MVAEPFGNNFLERFRKYLIFPSQMKKPRVLIIISIQFPIRILIRTGFLKSMAKYIDPVIALGWRNDDLKKEIMSMGFEVNYFPNVEFSSEHKNIINKIDYIWNERYQKSFSLILDKRIEKTMNKISFKKYLFQSIIRLYWSFKYFFKSQWIRLLEMEKKYFFENKKVKIAKMKLRDLNIDAILSQTPYNIHDEVILRIAKSNNIPICASILSFDNTTAYGRVPVIFDEYFLWNQNNRKELLRGYPKAINSKIEIIGAPQFDFYYNETYLWEEKYWREKLSLPLERPVILFGAGYYKIVPNEHHWLKQLDDGIENNEIKGNPIILFRIHPVDPINRWEPILKNAKHIVFDEPWKSHSIQKGSANIEKKDIEKLVSSLFHSSVHINASSTMTIDGAIFDRPQIGPAYDDMDNKKYDKIVKDLYRREHFIPIVKSGGLELAHSRKELVKLINSAFENPTKLSTQRKKMVKKVCTYSDGKSVDRLESVFKSFLKSRCLL